MGDSVAYARLLLAYVVGAIMTFVVSEVVGKLQPRAETYSSGTKAAKGTDWLNTAIDVLPAAYVLIGFLGIIAYSVFRRRLAA